MDRDIDSRTAALTYGYNPSGNDLVDLEVTLSYADQEISQEYVEGSSSSAPAGGYSVVNADHRYETTKLTARNTALFATGDVVHELRFGTEFTERERLDADSAPGGTGRRAALFAVDEMEIGNVTLTPALRYERSEIEGAVDSDGDGVDDLYTSYQTDALVGGLSARYAFANGFSIFASGAYTEVLPILDDLDAPFDRSATNDRIVTTSEKARTWEIGAAFDRTGLFGRNDVLALKANLYQTTLWDVSSYSDVAEVDLNGVEIEGSYAIESGWYTDLNANFVESTAYDAERIESTWANTPQDSIRMTVGKTFGEALDLSWEGLHAFDDEDAGDEVEDYTLYALRASYTPQGGAFAGTEVRLGLENATDVLVTPELGTRPIPGRTLKVTLARTF